MRWIVVGAGSAGCVVAARLAEAGEDVILLEAGAGAPDPASASPSFFDATAAPGLTYPGPFTRGRGVGGSGAVNGMIATHGDEAQFRSWGWTDTAAAFARIRVPTEPADDAELGPIDRALLAAAPDAERAQLTRRAGRRVSTFEAYLQGGPPVDLRAGVEGRAVRFDGDRAVGVDLADGTVVEGDAVVVSAGAIGSPLLLSASGVDHPDLGRHFRNHPAVPVDLVLRPGAPWDPHGLVAATFLRRGDLQVLSVNHLGPAVPRTAGVLIALMTPSGEGVVDDATTVETVLTAGDRTRLAEGVAMVGELVAAPPFDDVVEDLRVGEAPAGVYHPTSTCRMGDVVDEDGAVVGRRDLFVVDASIFPDLPTTNTYLPTLMLAERMVGRVLTRRRAAPPSTPA